MISEKVLRPVPGLPMALLLVGTTGFAGWLFYHGARTDSGTYAAIAVALFLLICVTLPGLVMNQPNEARVLTLFGRYAGSVKEAGLWLLNPFTVKKRISLRTRNF